LVDATNHSVADLGGATFDAYLKAN
jgi:hypothetical protein